MSLLTLDQVKPPKFTTLSHGAQIMLPNGVIIDLGLYYEIDESEAELIQTAAKYLGELKGEIIRK